jgi:hypothetical protein
LDIFAGMQKLFQRMEASEAQPEKHG